MKMRTKWSGGIIAVLALTAVLILGIGNAWAADCGDTDSDGITDTICACGDTVVGATGYTYTLPADLTCTNEGNALTVGSSGITIDGDGHTIYGTNDDSRRDCSVLLPNGRQPSGLFVSKEEDVTIKGLTVKHHCGGIFTFRSSDIRIENCTIRENGNINVLGSSTFGITLYSTGDSVVTGCTIYGQEAGPDTAGPPGGIGIWHSGGDYNEFSYNTIHDCAAAGMFVHSGSQYGWIHHNTVRDNPFGGIRLNCIQSAGFTVENNLIYSNWDGESATNGYGIFFGGYEAAPNNVARDNIVRWNRVGIEFSRNAYVGEVYNNIASDNADYDIYVQDYAVVTGSGNTCDSFYNYGDDSVGEGNGCLFTSAAIADSDGDVIPDYIPGTTDALDNCRLTANPGQEDTDEDGYGNACDCDLDNDGIVKIADLRLFKAAYGDDCVDNGCDADFDGSGKVDRTDYRTFKSRYGDSLPFE